jgi:acetyl esterase/lipase
MKKIFFVIILVNFHLAKFSQQKVIQLYKGVAPGSENWTYSERSDSSQMPLVYNVSQPTLTVYLPDPKIATGTAIILCPGGGFFILDMKNASVDVAKWLNEKGITVFLLKYRLAQIFTDKPVQEVYSHIKR